MDIALVVAAVVVGNVAADRVVGAETAVAVGIGYYCYLRADRISHWVAAYIDCSGQEGKEENRSHSYS